MIEVTKEFKCLKLNNIDYIRSQFVELEINSSIETIDYTPEKDKKVTAIEHKFRLWVS